MALMWDGMGPPKLKSLRWVAQRRNLEGLPQPRDWSPKLEEARKRLDNYRRLLPSHSIVSLKRIQEGAPQLVAAVSAGWAFVAKVGKRYELLYVEMSGGNIIMTEWMWNTLTGLTGGDP